MADGSLDSRAHRKQQSHRGAQNYASCNKGQSHASSAYYGNNPYASSSRQTNPASSSTQHYPTADCTSSETSTSRDEGFPGHRYHQVPRTWTSQTSEHERKRILDHPALAYSCKYSSDQNHDHSSHAPQTSHPRPEQLVPSRERSRQLTPDSLHGHDQQTQQSSAMMRWAQQTQQEEPWNGVGSVRNRSEFDPYHTRL